MPFDLQMYVMLRYLPGYTWATLESEEDYIFEALWECIRAERSSGGGSHGNSR